ncbi:MAG: hypothetical protein M2R45_01544 [Verrucomicrobia subdivision 3 bacterium]|nr:hypothetical protein [Limisphaerales bacterium]MCS1413328.1 hypothetical protein [Limisphaerales bacterium]
MDCGFSVLNCGFSESAERTIRVPLNVAFAEDQQGADIMKLRLILNIMLATEPRQWSAGAVEMIVVAAGSSEPSQAQKDVCICYCNDVPASTIRAAIDSGAGISMESLKQVTGAGAGCGACQCRLQRMLLGLPVGCGPCGFCNGCGLIQRLCTCRSLVA